MFAGVLTSTFAYLPSSHPLAIVALRGLKSDHMKRNFFLLLLLVLQAPLWAGCTAMLWERSTFSNYYHAAGPPNLQLYYSDERNDLLVQYNESRNKEKKVRTRYYWLEPNVKLTGAGRKPIFVDHVSLDG